MSDHVKPREGAIDADEVVEATLHKPKPPPPPRLRNATRPIALSGDPTVARDLMTRELFTIAPEDKLESLEQHMEALHFRHLPVVEDDKPVGLITRSDLLHASSSFLTNFSKEVDERVHSLPALRIMHTDFASVRPDTPILDVAAMLWTAHSECVLVTDDAGKLVGIITETDFVRLAHHLLQSRR